MKSPAERAAPSRIEHIIAWVGSTPSLIFHTGVFLGLLFLTVAGPFPRDSVLLVWNTMVSLEAIYLALFIQFSVNKNTQSLKEVEVNIDEIQEDVEELGEDVEGIQEDLVEISEDIEEISEDIDEIQEDVEELNEEDDAATVPASTPRAKNVLTREEALEQLSTDVARVLADLEALKKTQ